jgi:hypothetical protein
MNQKWEYMVEEIRTTDAGGIAAILKKLAEYGWEFVSIGAVGNHYFRRPKT